MSFFSRLSFAMRFSMAFGVAPIFRLGLHLSYLCRSNRCEGQRGRRRKGDEPSNIPANSANSTALAGFMRWRSNYKDAHES